jgi:phosphoribosylformylglycinamidine synthase subunit PurQ / glutaminase
MPRALVIRTAGTNCDAELMRAFSMAGATPELVHLDRLIAEPQRVESFDLIGFPGGFSYGDDIASGRIFAMRAREHLYPALRDAARRGVPMIGVCNGFQILVQIGLLPGPAQGADWPENEPPAQETSLTYNAGGSFIDNWFGVAGVSASHCLWTRGLDEFGEQALRLPIAHGEGRFVTTSPATLDRLERSGQVALRYIENPNGSTSDIAGICDASGRIFGLMPHPERYLDWVNHPFWTRLPASTRRGETPGLRIFRNAVEAVNGGGQPAVASATRGASVGSAR